MALRSNDGRRLDQIVGDIRSLVAIPAPTFSERRRIEWINRRLVQAPGARRVDQAGNLVWTWGEGRPKLAIMAHVDTVFAKHEPLQTTISNGRLQGPGVGDNAAGIAVGISIFEELLGTMDLAPGAMVFTVCEEGLGNSSGAAAACTQLCPDAVIALEGHGVDIVVSQVVGSVRTRVTVTGPGGHSWIDRDEPSAVHGIVALARTLLDCANAEMAVNVGIIRGGTAVNAIANHAELLIEARSVAEEPLLDFTSRLQALEIGAPLSIDAETVGRRHARAAPEDTALMEATKSVRAELNLPARREARTTDAAAALDLGIPAISLGVATGGGIHTQGEWIDVSSLLIGREQMRRLVLLLLRP